MLRTLTQPLPKGEEKTALGTDGYRRPEGRGYYIPALRAAAAIT